MKSWYVIGILIIASFLGIIYVAVNAGKLINILPVVRVNQISTDTPYPTYAQSPPNTYSSQAAGFPLTLPKNFSLTIVTSNLPGARVIAQEPSGLLAISLTQSGKVVLVDPNTGEIQELLTGLRQPHGIAFDCTTSCRLYIAETDEVSAYTYDVVNHKATERTSIMKIPGNGQHFTRTLIINTQINPKKLLVSIGSSCNVCQETNSQRASIQESNLDGTSLQTFASGLRNSVFMTINPNTHDIWATEMGRDNLGDSLPPDEINIIRNGNNYGWPYCYGKRMHDNQFDPTGNQAAACAQTEGSYIDIPAHSAPLGLAFFPNEGWPSEYHSNILVAYHGSWNRTTPVGYKVVRYVLDNQGGFLGEEDFITGWLDSNNHVYGRPVDILIEPNSVMYITDDVAGILYKVSLVTQ